ncbi:MAG TPA: DUF1028 domain-containing protein [Acidimicrobiales bacterium]|nr:DUF1028 domain-containing protein [Acidimicrobiales bacterium]
MTYSIVARDPDSGQLGVAVQTCWFAVGAIVPWAVAGVGAVATQAMAEVSYGPKCLDRLDAGRAAGQALDEVRAEDAASAVRQVAVVDAAGGAGAFTGDLCIDHAGHHVGRQYSVQANMMASAGVWPAMAEAYETGTGTFPERLLGALRAAERAGGDARGGMSAAVLIVDGHRHDHPWEGVLVDVRVDHDDHPLDEIDRLVTVSDAFDHCTRAEEALFGSEQGSALAEVDQALRLLPGDENARFMRAGALIVSGQPDAGLSELRSLIAARPTWGVVVRSVAAKGLFPFPEGVDLDDVTG